MSLPAIIRFRCNKTQLSFIRKVRALLKTTLDYKYEQGSKDVMNTESYKKDIFPTFYNNEFGRMFFASIDWKQKVVHINIFSYKTSIL